MPAEARRILSEESKKTIADQSYVGALIRKWRDLLEGMPDRSEHDRYVLGCTAILMENESTYLQNLNEETKQANVGSFTKFIFPVLRRVFPNLIANEIVSVQPMTAPVGAVFFLDYVYGSTKGQTSQGNVFPRDFDKDYGSEYVNGEPMATGDNVNFGGAGAALVGNLAWNPVRPLNASLGFKLVISEVTALGVVVQTATDDGVGGFTGNVTAGLINYSNGSLTAFKFTNPPATGNQIKAYYYYDGELSGKVAQINLDVKKAPVEAVPRRLKALWSSEAAEDLRAFHGLDAETELVSAVAQEIALEIDREIINELFLNSTNTTATFGLALASVSMTISLKSMLISVTRLSTAIMSALKSSTLDRKFN